jgi:hypothetical protein
MKKRADSGNGQRAFRRILCRLNEVAFAVPHSKNLKKNGKLLTSRRYNHTPLLHSCPGGLVGAGRIRLAAAKIRKRIRFSAAPSDFIGLHVSMLKNHLPIGVSARSAARQNELR